MSLKLENQIKSLSKQLDKALARIEVLEARDPKILEKVLKQSLDNYLQDSVDFEITDDGFKEQ